MTAQFSHDDVDQERIIRAATDADNVGAEAGKPDVVAHAPEADITDSLLRRVLRKREVGLACAIAVVALPVMLLNSRMISTENLIAVAMDAALLMIVAVGQMLVLLTRNIDLSVASVIGLAAYGSASFMHANPDASVLAGIAVACAIGLACGLTNGVVVTIGRVPAIVVTLGTLAVFRGINSLVAGGRQISADQVPQSWLDVTSTKIVGVPAVVLIALVTLGLIALALQRLPHDGAGAWGVRHRRAAGRLRWRDVGFALRHHRCPRRDGL